MPEPEIGEELREPVDLREVRAPAARSPRRARARPRPPGRTGRAPPATAATVPATAAVATIARNDPVSTLNTFAVTSASNTVAPSLTVVAAPLSPRPG